MISERDQLIAYLATLGTLVFVFLAALIVAAIEPGVIGRIETIGLGAITGLIGILRMPSRASANVEKADTVNQGSGQ